MIKNVRLVVKIIINKYKRIMADSIREVNWLRYYYTSDDAVKDKDLLKDQAHIKLTHKVNALFMVPTVF